MATQRDQAVDLAYAQALVPNVPGHELPPPWPIHYHAGSYIVDEVCRCGKPRSQHEDTLQYGHGPSMDGTCPKFTWAGFLQSNGYWPTEPNVGKPRPGVQPVRIHKTTKRSKK